MYPFDYPRESQRRCICQLMSGEFFIADIGKVVLFNAAIGGTSVGGFTTLAVIQVYRHILAGVKVQAAIMPFASIDKKFVLAHTSLH
jgi:hypothetical protein